MISSSIVGFGFEETSQIGLKRLFSGRLSVGSEPVFKVSDPNLVLDLGLFDGDRNRRILMDPIDPIVLTKNEQASRCSLEEAARRDFNRVFRAVRVPAGYLASFQHARILALRFYFARQFEYTGPRIVHLVTRL
jgi:hypothetical protein